jgi:hypothetical protein
VTSDRLRYVVIKYGSISTLTRADPSTNMDYIDRLSYAQSASVELLVTNISLLHLDMFAMKFCAARVGRNHLVERLVITVAFTTTPLAI